MAPPPPPPPDPAVLIDELVEEFLLRLPPEEPALLARAALVSRQWYRVVTGPSFRRRFLSSSHGRVLLHRLSEEDMVAPDFTVNDMDVHLSVWHPITDEQQDLPVVPVRTTRYPNHANWDAAVVCDVGDGCDHLHCHFIVVFVGNIEGRNCSCFYSSEAGTWSDPVFAAESHSFLVPGKCIPIGTALYTTCGATDEIFKYDMQTHQMCNISTTPGPGLGRLIAAEDGRLGLAKASKSTLRLWLRENGRWEESRAIDLHTLLPADALHSRPFILDQPWVTAFADTGAGVIFLWTRVGVFTIDLKSGSCKNIGEVSARVVPYVNFCTPAPGAGVAISSDEVPVADIAVSTDEGPGAGVTVAADEGPGAAGMCQVPKLKLQVQGPLSQEGNE